MVATFPVKKISCVGKCIGGYESVNSSNTTHSSCDDGHGREQLTRWSRQERKNRESSEGLGSRQLWSVADIRFDNECSKCHKWGKRGGHVGDQIDPNTEHS